MRIAILDYFVIPNNAIGNCDRQIANGLCSEYDFTVFAVDFDNPNPERIKFVRVPAIRRPLFLLFVTYHLLVPVIFWWHCLRNRIRFDIVQSIESNSLLGGLVYAHFCHSAYLKTHWAATQPSGLRGAARWLDHKLHALLEPIVYRRGRKVVVPSHGLSRELTGHYGALVGHKTTVIANPIDVRRMQDKPVDFNRDVFRASLGLKPGDLGVIFIALGHFERKGLPLLMEAVKLTNDQRVRLILIGGTPATLEEYKQRASSLGITEQIHFAGMQKDVRPFLWASDIFSLPSSYEVFPLVSLEAAAAGVPLLVSPLNGVEEFIQDGVNGWQVPRDPKALADKLKSALEAPQQLETMGKKAAESALTYDLPNFLSRWREFYATWGQPTSVQPQNVAANAS